MVLIRPAAKVVFLSPIDEQEDGSCSFKLLQAGSAPITLSYGDMSACRAARSALTAGDLAVMLSADKVFDLIAQSLEEADALAVYNAGSEIERLVKQARSKLDDLCTLGEDVRSQDLVPVVSILDDLLMELSDV